MTAIEEKTEFAPAVRYGVSDAAIADLRSEVGSLRAEVDYDATRIAIGRIVKLRTGVEKRRKELKEDALKWSRKVDSEAKRLTGLLEEIETPLRDSKDAVDLAVQRARGVAANAERLRQEAAAKAERDRLEAARQANIAAENAKLAAEREALRLEREKMAAEREAQAAAMRAETAKHEEARREALRLEREQIAQERETQRQAFLAEQTKLTEARKKQAEEQVKIDAERKRIEAEQQAERDRLAKIESDRLAAIQAEADRVAEEKRLAEEAARLEALKPDKEKLTAFAAKLRGIKTPELSTEEGSNLLVVAMIDVNRIADRLTSWAK